MAETLRVAAVQLNSTPDKADNLEAGRAARGSAPPRPAPTSCSCREVERDRLDQDARRTPSPLTAADRAAMAMGQAARDHARRRLDHRSSARRTAGSLVRAASSTAGELVAIYRKIHMFDVDVGGHRYRESDAEEPRRRDRCLRRGRLAARALRLLRPPLSRALPNPRGRGRRDRHRPGRVRALHRQGSLGLLLQAARSRTSVSPSPRTSGKIEGGRRPTAAP